MPARTDQPDPEAALHILGIAHDFGSRRVLAEVSLALARGEVVALLGASGCGKTTLLRLVAGLLAPTAGRIAIAGRVVAAPGRSLPPEARGLGMVFQDYALWPHLSVARNVAFPLEMRGVPRAERERRVAEALERVGLGGFGGRAPGTLSGGQQQRVALARALVARPPLILFDEPLSNLDKELRDSLARDIALLLREERLSALYVTHDRAEAFAVADRVAVMAGGRILQDDAPETLVARPASPEVARFLDLGALLPGEVRGRRFRHGPSGLSLPVAAPDGPAEALLPRRALRPDPAGPIAGEIAGQRFRGDDVLVSVRLAGGALLSVAAPARLPPGPVRLALDPGAATVFAGGAAHPVLSPIPEEA
ncbi:MAG: ABC transporter ATP-binding protein [Acetobacteraceae bacterium]|nr:ABC transporter ATP-binding protein [Acetobacteraceae bacterium]MDW8397915.1 ABC transporter ATP-binding protein [Acetobacteraceae bacterium]